MEEKNEKFEGLNLQSPQYSNISEKPDYSPTTTPFKRSSYPTLAGSLLIISGVIALLFWISVVTIDVSTIESLIDISQLQQIDPTITSEQIKELLTTCGTVAAIISVFPILGGILSLKRKLWGMALAGGILGLFTMGPFFSSSILSLVGLILIVISRKEFQ